MNNNNNMKVNSRLLEKPYINQMNTWMNSGGNPYHIWENIKNHMENTENITEFTKD